MKKRHNRNERQNEFILAVIQRLLLDFGSLDRQEYYMLVAMINKNQQTISVRSSSPIST